MLNKHPENYGLASERILSMVQELETFVEDIHSISVICGEDVIFTKCVEPYNETCRQMLHSFAKSINSLAVGLAVNEGKLHLDDLVADHFREYLPRTYDKRLEKLTVKNLLTMAASSCRLSTCFRGVESSWITHYFTHELPHEPGTAFQYDTGASYMLSSLVTKTMGKNVLALMKERVFGPMGITDVDWLESPEGNTVGGWGLYLTTPDIAKIAILLANMGKWNGVSLVPEKYLKEAGSKQIDTPEDTGSTYGYGYQFWLAADHSYCVYGAFGNVIVVQPEKRMAVAVTAGASDKNGNPNRLISRIVNDQLFIPSSGEKLPENEEAEKQLCEYLAHLVLPYAEGKKASELECGIMGKTVFLQENERKLTSLKIERVDAETLKITFGVDGKAIEVLAGYEKWIDKEAVFDDVLHHVHSFSYGFADDKTLVIKQYSMNLSGYDVYTLHFYEDTMNGIITTSVKLGGAVPVELTGTMR